MALQQGRFIPRNTKKYNGNNIKDIRFRSGWERKAMVFFDLNPNIIEWSSESVVIPYISPIDGRKHRYFPDFLVKLRTKDGTIKTCLYEVKPAAQTRPPKQKKKTKRFLAETHTWVVNSAKWEAAMRYSEHMGWEFTLLTENELGING